MTVRVYRSSDASAPVLTGQAGSMITLLDAVLVNGYGALAAAGWTKEFSGTNKAVYRNDSVGGSGTYYRVQDDLASTNQRYAYLTQYEAASGIDAGTGQAPPTVANLGFFKSNTQDATPRPWVIVANDRFAHVFIQHGGNGTDWMWNFMGDIQSYKSADAYRGVIGGMGNGSSAITSLTHTSNTMARVLQLGSADNGIYIARSHAGSGAAITCGLHCDVAKAATAFSSASNAYIGSSTFNALAYPNAVNSGLFVSPVWIHQTGSSPYVVRGHLPGTWAPMHNRPLANNDTFTGAGGAISGKTFEAFNVYNGAQILIETSDTWS